jgi:hypothetical protein
MNTLDPPPAASTCPFITPAQAARLAGAVCLADVPNANTRWLWPDRIPFGRVTLLVSDPGLGKSLVALDVAARVSRGASWPDEQDPQDKETRKQAEKSTHPPVSLSPCLSVSPSSPSPSTVLLLTAEDDLSDTVRPRLEALQADCSKIIAFPAILDENDRPAGRMIDLRHDLARITNLLDSLPFCRLLVIDPVNAYVGGGDVQSVLLSLSAVARQRGIAVLAVSHLRKKEGAAIYRAAGSVTFVSSARAVWVLCFDPANSERRLLLPLKNNLTAKSSGLAYNVVAGGNGSPRIEWSKEPVEVSAELAVGTAARPRGRPNDECRHAIEWLRDRLAEKACPSQRVKDEAAAHGIAERTLFRAFRELGGEAVRAGFGPLGHWVWKLPGIDCQISEADIWQSLSFLDDFPPPAPVDTTSRDPPSRCDRNNPHELN